MNDKAFAVSVRPSTGDDIAAIQAIYAHHVTHGLGSFEEQQPSVEVMAERRLAVVERGLPHLVAEEGGRVVGFAYVGPYRPRPAYRFTLEDSVYVTPDTARQGVGRALLSELIRIVEVGPWRQMIAAIGDRGNSGSIALHASLGFHEAGHLRGVGFKHGRWVDVILMQRALGVGEGREPD
ncbi:MAG: N-acetyltransferase family protein [Alphaproteobacteria bacterium]|nr:N-acetyltransferase family protein [Alphaproteobacteria bacterium]